MMNENKKINKDLLQKITILEFALEECIKQFDYSNNKKWRNEFKKNMMIHAQNQFDNMQKNQS